MRSIFTQKSLPYSFLLLGVFFMPFNSFDGFEVLGEYKRDSCFLFFFFSGVFLFFKNGISVPFHNSLFKLLLITVTYFFLTGLLNIYDLSHYYFKHTTGLNRFIRQFVSLFLSSIFLVVVFYSVLKHYSLKSVFFNLRKVMSYSLVIVTIYAIIEVLIVKFQMKNFRPVLDLFNYLPFIKAHIDTTTNRISSLTFESPALATYLISISGWMFSYILTEKGAKRFIPIICTIILSFFSGSRAGIFVIIIQIIVFIFYIIKDKKFNKLFINIFLLGTACGIVTLIFFSKPIFEYVESKILSFKTDDDVHAVSNKSRFGIQVALFEVFLNNPIKGTGYGLQAYESRKFYPEWAVKNNWEFKLKYLNEDHRSFPPGYNLYIRLLAETGLIGFLLFIFFLLVIFLWCYNKTFKRQGPQTIMPLVITISMVGFMFNWAKMDTFRIYFFWLSLVLIILLQSQGKLNGEKENTGHNTTF